LIYHYGTAFFQPLEYIVYRGEVESGLLLVTNHREGLSRSRLSIGHDAYVKAIETRSDKVLNLLRHRVLALQRVKNAVEDEALLTASPFPANDNLVVVGNAEAQVNSLARQRSRLLCSLLLIAK